MSEKICPVDDLGEIDLSGSHAAQEPQKITPEDNNMEQAILEKSEWYVVQGAAGRLAVVPEAELRGREVLTTFQCSGVRDALDQLHDYEAHQKYLRELADRGRYVDGKATSFLTPPSKILDLAPKYPWANRDQLDEIAAGIQEGLAPELRSLYAKPEFSAIQMNAIRCALTSGLPLENVVVLVDPAFDSVQMDVIRAGFEAGMTHEQVRSYAKPEIPAQQMLDAYWNIRGQTKSPWRNLSACWDVKEDLNTISPDEISKSHKEQGSPDL